MGFATAVVGMPEAAVDQNYFAQSRKNQVRPTGKIPDMQPKTKTHCVNEPSDG